MLLFPKAFPVITGKGDRVSGGRGTKNGLMYEVFSFVHQPIVKFACLRRRFIVFLILLVLCRMTQLCARGGGMEGIERRKWGELPRTIVP